MGTWPSDELLGVSSYGVVAAAMAILDNIFAQYHIIPDMCIWHFPVWYNYQKVIKTGGESLLLDFPKWDIQ